MTREEAKLILQENFGLLSFEYPGRISEAIKIAIEVLSQLSLPSDLDEAAEEYALDVKAKPYGNLVKDAFKAGAEWMAKQGYSYEDKVYLLEGGDTYESYPELDGEGEGQCIDKAVKVGYLKVGDKVIVQIRKK